jgi:hypothetical protein
MANSVIDSKTDKTSFGNIVVKENISTELSLVLTGNDQFGINYQISFTGTKTGSTSGGPIAVSQNGTIVANANPKVTATISGYSDTGTTISMQVVVQVAIPVLGTKTIFDETLAGPYSGVDNLAALVNRIADVGKGQG